MHGRCIALYGKIGFLPSLKLVLVYEVSFGLLGSHLDLPEHIIMAIPCRFIYSVEVVINGKKFLKSTCGGNSFSSKVNIRGILSTFLEYKFQNMLCTNSCYEIFRK